MELSTQGFLATLKYCLYFFFFTVLILATLILHSVKVLKVFYSQIFFRKLCEEKQKEKYFTFCLAPLMSKVDSGSRTADAGKRQLGGADIVGF